MVAGLLLFDLLFILLATLCHGSALAAGAWVYSALAARVPWPFAVVPAVYVGLLVLVAEVSLGTALCPRLRAGRFPLMKGAVFFSWTFRMLLRRVVSVPGVKFLLFSNNLLRFLLLRGLGARVAFSANMSSDVELLDPALLSVGAGAVLGARTMISSHYIDQGMLVLGEIHVGEGALLAFDVGCGPGVRIGRRASIRPRSTVSVDVELGEGANVGMASVLEAGVILGAGARVSAGTFVPRGTRVQDGGRYPARDVPLDEAIRASSTTSSAAPAV